MHDDAIPRRWRLAGIASAAAGFLLVSAAIHISTYDVQYGTRIWAQPEMEAGGLNAVRISVQSRRTGGPVPGATAKVSLVRRDDERAPKRPPEEAGIGDEAIHLGRLEPSDTGFIEESMSIPADFTPGQYSLLVHIDSPVGPDELAAFPVSVLPSKAIPRRGWAVIRPVCEESSGRKQDGGWHPARRCTRGPGPVHLYPEAGHLVGHIEAPLHVWVRRDLEVEPGEDEDESPREEDVGSDEAMGIEPRRLPEIVEIVPLRPAAPGTSLREPAGRPVRAPLDVIGLTSFMYEPTFPRGSLLVKIGDIEERIWLRDLPTPLSIVPQSRLLRTGGLLEIELVARRPNLPALIEIWYDGRWLSAHSGRVQGYQERLGVPLPREARGLVMIRAGLGPGGGSRSFVTAWVWEDTSASGLRDLARELADLPLAEPLAHYSSRPPPPEPLIEWVSSMETSVLDEMSQGERERLAGAMLSRVEPSTAPPPRLGDTTGEKLLALDAWKERVRRPILAALILLASATLLSIGWLAVSYQGRVRRRIEQIELHDLDDEDEPDEGRITQGGWLGFGLMLGAVLIAAMASLLVFLETLRWNRGDVFAARQREAAAETMRQSD